MRQSGPKRQSATRPVMSTRRGSPGTVVVGAVVVDVVVDEVVDEVVDVVLDVVLDVVDDVVLDVGDGTVVPAGGGAVPAGVAEVVGVAAVAGTAVISDVAGADGSIVVGVSTEAGAGEVSGGAERRRGDSVRGIGETPRSEQRSRTQEHGDHAVDHPQTSHRAGDRNHRMHGGRERVRVDREGPPVLYVVAEMMQRPCDHHVVRDGRVGHHRRQCRGAAGGESDRLDDRLAHPGILRARSAERHDLDRGVENRVSVGHTPPCRVADRVELDGDRWRRGRVSEAVGPMALFPARPGQHDHDQPDQARDQGQHIAPSLDRHAHHRRARALVAHNVPSRHRSREPVRCHGFVTDPT